jgi:hypothetical protein
MVHQTTTLSLTVVIAEVILATAETTQTRALIAGTLVLALTSTIMDQVIAVAEVVSIISSGPRVAVVGTRVLGHCILMVPRRLLAHHRSMILNHPAPPRMIKITASQTIGISNVMTTEIRRCQRVEMVK